MSPPSLSPSQWIALQALVDTVWPPLSVPHYDEAEWKRVVVGDPSRYWTFRLSYDTYFGETLRQVLDNNDDPNDNNDRIRSSLDRLAKANRDIIVPTTNNDDINNKEQKSFVEWTPSEQAAWLSSVLSSNNNDLQKQLEPALRQLQRAICQVALTYHPAMSSTTAVMVVDSHNNNNVPGSTSQSSGVLSSTNPFWSTLGYPPSARHWLGRMRDAQAVVRSRNHNHKAPGVLPPRPTLSGNTTVMECDVIVVGSGAGGSVAAAVLAQAGYHVIVVEQGPRVSGSTGTEQDAFQHQGTRSVPLSLGENKFAGSMTLETSPSIVGGSTTTHSGACPVAPQFVLDHWVTQHGLKDFDVLAHHDEHDIHGPSPYQASLQTVLKRLGTTAPYHDNVVNRKLRDACIRFGYHWSPVPQSVQPRPDQYYPNQPDVLDPHVRDSAGYVALGDRYGQRVAAGEAFLSDAARSQGPCQLWDSCQVTRLFTSTTHGVRNVTGVECHDHQQNATVTLRARKCVVLATGALQTPVLLQKSGLDHEHLGRHLKLHPTLAVFGFTELEPPSALSSVSSESILKNNSSTSDTKLVNGFEGLAESIACYPPATTLLEENPAQSQQPQSLIHAASVHPGWMASHLPFTTPPQFKDRMRRLRYCVPFLCTLSDSESSQGHVRWNARKNKVEMGYELHANDTAILCHTVLTATRLQIASGAQEVSTVDSIQDKLPQRESAPLLDQYVQEHIESNHLVERNLFSSVAMGSCRMSALPSNGVVDMYGEFWNCNNLFVMDASILPSATLVNPLITILACAHMLSTKLAKRLQAQDGHPLNDQAAARAHEIKLVRLHSRMQLHQEQSRKTLQRAIVKATIGLAVFFVLFMFWWLDLLSSG